MEPLSLTITEELVGPMVSSEKAYLLSVGGRSSFRTFSSVAEAITWCAGLHADTTKAIEARYSDIDACAAPNHARSPGLLVGQDCVHCQADRWVIHTLKESLPFKR